MQVGRIFYRQDKGNVALVCRLYSSYLAIVDAPLISVNFPNTGESDDCSAAISLYEGKKLPAEGHSHRVPPQIDTSTRESYCLRAVAVLAFGARNRAPPHRTDDRK